MSEGFNYEGVSANVLLKKGFFELHILEKFVCLQYNYIFINWPENSNNSLMGKKSSEKSWNIQNIYMYFLGQLFLCFNLILIMYTLSKLCLLTWFITPVMWCWSVTEKRLRTRRLIAGMVKKWSITQASRNLLEESYEIMYEREGPDVFSFLPEPFFNGM